MRHVSRFPKIKTAKQVFRNYGWLGLLKVGCHKCLFYNWWRKRDHWLIGKWIELRGDIVELDGCQFSTDNVAISTKLKSRFWFDRYEHPERLAIRQYLDPHQPVVEFGGSIGVVACLTNKRLHDPSRHIVVEANPVLVPLLEQNRDRNGCRFRVLNRAIGYGARQITFYQNKNFLQSGAQIPTGDPIQVDTICLAEIVRQYSFDQCTLICDIEGGEIDLVRFEIECLKNNVQTLILETHDKLLRDGLTATMVSQLLAVGFEIIFERKGTYVFRANAPRL